jgi:hypothetical protein
MQEQLRIEHGVFYLLLFMLTPKFNIETLFLRSLIRCFIIASLF